jgi:hypothetical protein
MDSTLASRTTHIKIVAVSLVAAIAMLVVGINAKTGHFATAHVPDDGVIVKTGQPASYAGQGVSTIR